VRAEAGKCLQTFFKYNAASVCMFSDKDRLSALFLQEEHYGKDGGALTTIAHDQGIGYLPWR